jgi:hypothetical protein
MNAPASPLARSRVVQVAYHVDDVREAARRWNERTGVGPFFVQDHVPIVRATSGGMDVVLDQSCAVTQWGEVMLELVRIHSFGPAALERAVVPHGTGLHHVAVFVDDLNAALSSFEASSVPVVLDAETDQTRFVFVDPGPEFGHLVECYEAGPYLQRLYAAVRRTAAQWDGNELFK